jgi:hypothetical protein
MLADLAINTIHAAWLAVVAGVIGRRVFRANWKKMDLTYRHVHHRMKTIELLLIEQKMQAAGYAPLPRPTTPFTNLVNPHMEHMPLGARPRHSTGRASMTILGYRITRRRLTYVITGALIIGVVVTALGAVS